MKKFSHIIITLAGILFLYSCTQKNTIEELILTDNWHLHSAEGLNQDGATLSVSPVTDNWIQTSLPATVLGALCNAGLYKDPFSA